MKRAVKNDGEAASGYMPSPVVGKGPQGLGFFSSGDEAV